MYFKIGALAVALVVTVGFTLLTFVKLGTERTVLKLEDARLNRTVDLAVQTFAAEIEHAANDVQVIAGTPTAGDVIQSLKSSKTDPASGLFLTQSEDLLANYFGVLLTANASYLQARFIGVDGREIVRVDKTAEGIERVPQNVLQHKGDRPYFKNTLTQSPGSVYVSDVELNQENGKVIEPHQPVVHVATVAATQFGLISQTKTELI